MVIYSLCNYSLFPDMRKVLLLFGFISIALGILFAPLFSNANDGLIGYWKFDGNGVNEVAGSPTAVVQTNAVFRSSGGKLGGYAYIPAQGDAVKIPYASMFDLPDSFTIEFWFRQRANQAFFQDLVYKGSPINNYNFRVFRQLWNENNFGPIITGYTSLRTRYWTQTSNPNQLAHNEWHHVAYTKNAAQSAYYLDGILIHSSSQTDPAVTPANDIMIGSSAVDTDIDNLRIYNRALNLSEVLQNSGLPGREPLCASQQKQCVGNILQACAGDRFSWITAQNCDNGCDANTLSCNAPPAVAPSATSTPAAATSTPASVIATLPIATSTPSIFPQTIPQTSVVPASPVSAVASDATSTQETAKPTPILSRQIPQDSSGTSSTPVLPVSSATTTNQIVPTKGETQITIVDIEQEQKKIKKEALDFARDLAILSREAERLQKAGASLSESFKQTLTNARDISEYVKTTSEVYGVQDIRAHMEKLRNSLNEYIPTLEYMARSKGVIRIAKRQIVEAQRLKKSAANAAKRRGVDVKELLTDMDTHISTMKSALTRLGQETVLEELPTFSTQNFSDQLNTIRELESHVRAIINVKQFIKKKEAEIKQLNKKIGKLRKSSLQYQEVKALILEIQKNLTELRPLANQRLTEESVDQILSYLESLTDAFDAAKDALDITSGDALSSQLETLFSAPSQNLKGFE